MKISILLLAIMTGISGYAKATGIKILLSNEASATSTQIQFSKNSTPGFDKGLDKELTNIPENKINYIYSTEGDARKMYVNFCPLSETYQSIPIQIAVEKEGTFAISIENANGEYNNLRCTLCDLKTMKTISLDQFCTDEIFFGESDLHTKRDFILNVFLMPEITTVPVSCYGEKNGAIKIHFKDETEWQAKIRSGKKTFTNTLFKSNEANFDNLPADVYFVEIWKGKNIIYEEVVAVSNPQKTIPQFNVTQQPFSGGTKLFTENNSIGAASWHWDFGDTTSSDEFSPTHEYVKPGYYMITLTVTDPAGCVVTSRKSLQIGN